MLSLLTTAVVCADDSWKYLSSYPPQYNSVRLGAGESITIDGNINEKAWEEVPWTTDTFLDIAGASSIPPGYETRVKVRWDPEYLYIAAELRETVVWGNITGHNDKLTGGKAPWWNNDFEVFIDTHGSSHYYKEFEMNARNATYDVLWRVPDGGMNSKGVPCEKETPNWCQNSTYHVNQTWTMYPRMKTAVKTPDALTPFGPSSWVTEIRFPIEGNSVSGGLVDTEPGAHNSGDNPANGKQFWWVNFARAQHPLLTLGPNPLSINFFEQDYTDLCVKIQQEHPTLLGTGPWGCYWEFVWASMGITQYMHNPEMWGLLQFSTTPEPKCLTQEWPGRHLTQMLYRSQFAFYQNTGRYTDDVKVLSGSSVCNSTTICDPSDVATALASPDIFSFNIVVDNNSTSCVDFTTKKPIGGPCFNISVQTTAPGNRFKNTISVRENRLVNAITSNPSGCM